MFWIFWRYKKKKILFLLTINPEYIDKIIKFSLPRQQQQQQIHFFSIWTKHVLFIFHFILLLCHHHFLLFNNNLKIIFAAFSSVIILWMNVNPHHTLNELSYPHQLSFSNDSAIDRRTREKCVTFMWMMNMAAITCNPAAIVNWVLYGLYNFRKNPKYSLGFMGDIDGIRYNICCDSDRCVIGRVITIGRAILHSNCLRDVLVSKHIMHWAGFRYIFSWFYFQIKTRRNKFEKKEVKYQHSLSYRISMDITFWWSL